jgi:hypothetical protein
MNQEGVMQRLGFKTKNKRLFDTVTGLLQAISEGALERDLTPSTSTSVCSEPASPLEPIVEASEFDESGASEAPKPKTAGSNHGFIQQLLTRVKEHVVNKKPEAAQAETRARSDSVDTISDPDDKLREHLVALEALYNEIKDQKFSEHEVFYLNLLMFYFGKIDALDLKFNDDAFAFAVLAYDELAFRCVDIQKAELIGNDKQFRLKGCLPHESLARLLSQIQFDKIDPPEKTIKDSRALYTAFSCIQLRFDTPNETIVLNPAMIEAMSVGVMEANYWVTKTKTFGPEEKDKGSVKTLEIYQVAKKCYLNLEADALRGVLSHLPETSRMGEALYQALWDHHLQRVKAECQAEDLSDYGQRLLVDPEIQVLLAHTNVVRIKALKGGEIDAVLKEASRDAYGRSEGVLLAEWKTFGKNGAYINELFAHVMPKLSEDSEKTQEDVEKIKSFMLAVEQQVLVGEVDTASRADLFVKCFEVASTLSSSPRSASPSSGDEASSSEGSQSSRSDSFAYFDRLIQLFLAVFENDENQLETLLEILMRTSAKAQEMFCDDWIDGKLPKALNAVLNDFEAWREVQVNEKTPFYKVLQEAIRRKVDDKDFLRKAKTLPLKALKGLKLEKRITCFNALQANFETKAIPGLLQDMFLPLSLDETQNPKLFLKLVQRANLSESFITSCFQKLPDVMANALMVSALNNAPPTEKYKLFLKIMPHARVISREMLEASGIHVLDTKANASKFLMCAQNLGQHWRKCDDYSALVGILGENKQALATLYLAIAGSFVDTNEDRGRLKAFRHQTEAQFKAVFKGDLTRLMKETNESFSKSLGDFSREILKCHDDLAKHLTAYTTLMGEHMALLEAKMASFEGEEAQAPIMSLEDLDSDKVPGEEDKIREQVQRLAASEEAMRTSAKHLQKDICALMRMIVSPLVLRHIYKGSLDTDTPKHKGQHADLAQQYQLFFMKVYQLMNAGTVGNWDELKAYTKALHMPEPPREFYEGLTKIQSSLEALYNVEGIDPSAKRICEKVVKACFDGALSSLLDLSDFLRHEVQGEKDPEPAVSPDDAAIETLEQASVTRNPEDARSASALTEGAGLVMPPSKEPPEALPPGSEPPTPRG